jgi:hypothetical protein
MGYEISFACFKNFAKKVRNIFLAVFKSKQYTGSTFNRNCHQNLRIFSIKMNFTYPKPKSKQNPLDYCLPKGNQYLNIRCDWFIKRFFERK